MESELRSSDPKTFVLEVARVVQLVGRSLVDEYVGCGPVLVFPTYRVSLRHKTPRFEA